MKRVQFTLEFLFKASPNILYKFLSTTSCLVRWFCDKVDIQGDAYTFTWGETQEVAYLIDDFEEELLRFRWEDAPSPVEFLEYKISESPITGETILHITDFCDEGEVNEMRQIWTNQMKDLQKETGG
jgi:uncharacterized protein YndB with AHSA1/START domain